MKSACVSPLDLPLQDLCHSTSALTGRQYRKWLMDLRISHSLVKFNHSALLDRLLEGYDNARHGTGVSLSLNLWLKIKFRS